MSRFQHGPLLLAEPAEVGDVSWSDNLRPLMPGERTPEPRDSYVPEQLSTADGAVAAWVESGESMRDPDKAFAVIRRAPDLDAFPSCRPSPFHRDGSRAVIEALRAGKPVPTSTVVRIACHILETT